MNKPKCFLVRLDTYEIIEKLSDEKRGQLFTALYKYSSDGTIPQFNNDALDIAFLTFRKDIDYNRKAYEKRSEINRVNGSRGGAPSGNKNAKKWGVDKTAQETTEINRKQPKTTEIKQSVDFDKAEKIRIIITYLNEKTGKHYKFNGQATRQHINARLDEGFTVNDFKTVIDNQCAKWLRDPKMADYLRPETLFCTKFESYLNSSPRPNKPTPQYKQGVDYF